MSTVAMTTRFTVIDHLPSAGKLVRNLTFALQNCVLCCHFLGGELTLVEAEVMFDGGRVA